MKGNFRRSMIWLHTYSGLLLSWLLFAVFVTGTLSYYADELDVWMQPEKLEQQAQQQVIPQAIAALNQKAQGASRWNINLGNERDPKAEIRWQMPGQGRRDGQRESLSSTDVQPRETVGGSFFVHFHYTLELREYGGRYITGIAAFTMLIGVFTGIFTHRRFFKDFFLLRWQNLKRAMIDAHAIIGIVTIPFCFVICLSGMMFYFSLYVPASANYHYDKGYRQLSSQVSPKGFDRKASGELAQPIQNITPILDQVKSQWSEPNSISWVSYYHPYDQNGYLMFYRNKSDLSRQSETLTFDASSGELLHQTQAPRVPKLISYVFLGLHEGKFASDGLRFILFILGTLSSALIATGAILWLNNRIERNVSHSGTKLIDWSNKALLGGLPIGIACLFLANRLLPAQIDGRYELEWLSFFGGWGSCLLLAMAFKARQYWQHNLLLLAILLLSLPLIDLVGSGQYLITAIQTGNLTFLGVEMGIVTSALLALVLRRYLSQRQLASHKKPVKATMKKAASC
ncbi:PepSY-associated TM helix domain-containing protein [Parashewanella tropica]|uniref:PepSY-associated TM helix domain-containing protein n=1 Tax=Parashewanella tropica TaxID=2547970 RepID=UPI001059CEFC|nr:PepSY-associated TM helix domain-containing protein [Parashewanella tropica]